MEWIKYDTLFDLIEKEIKQADAKHGPMPEMVEGLHTLKCEVAELEREVMRANRSDEELKKEAIQVAAMGVKFLRDIVFK